MRWGEINIEIVKRIMLIRSMGNERKIKRGSIESVRKEEVGMLRRSELREVE